MTNTKEKMNTSYIENKLAGIFEAMVASVIKENPADKVKNIQIYRK